MSWRRRGAGAAVIVLLAAALALLVGSRLASGGSAVAGGDLVLAATDGRDTPGGDARVSVSGSVTGLFPGAHKALAVIVKNTTHVAIRVTRLSATVGNASATCAGANLSVGSFNGSRRVPASGSATITLPVTMSHAAGDACQGVHFPLHYSATATRADDSDSPSPSGCDSEGDEQCA